MFLSDSIALQISSVVLDYGSSVGLEIPALSKKQDLELL